MAPLADLYLGRHVLDHIDTAEAVTQPRLLSWFLARNSLGAIRFVCISDPVG